MQYERLSIKGASCRAYFDAPSWRGKRTVSVGDFQCDSPAHGAELLSAVESKCRAGGFGALIGPMDGDTWHAYRVVAASDGSPPFLMEPASGVHVYSAFEAGGFAPISSYVSARTTLREAIGSGAPASVDGVTVTSWDGSNPESLLEHIFDMCEILFARNPFFKPIAKSEFLAHYRPMLSAVDPRLVFSARSGDQLLGFLFAIPNWLEGRTPASVILKTYASTQRGVRPSVGRYISSHRVRFELHNRDLCSDARREFLAPARDPLHGACLPALRADGETRGIEP